MENRINPHSNFRLNLLTLSFSGSLENDFTESHIQNSLRQVRIALLLGLFLYCIFGILDAWLVPEAKHKLWIVRYAFILPFVTIVFLFSFSQHFKKYCREDHKECRRFNRNALFNGCDEKSCFSVSNRLVMSFPSDWVYEGVCDEPF